MEVDDNLLTKETDEDKKEEVEMLEEFERRRKFKTVYESLEENEERARREKEELTKTQSVENSQKGDEKIEEVLKADADAGETYDSRYRNL
jgi:Cys-tRNA synthase (O-phospho-L-seryl-tRNA:Cys-tRNA synthase)